MAIIGISGRISSGKDTVGMIIQYLISKYKYGYINPNTLKDFKSFIDNRHDYRSNWQIKKFAYAVKQVCSILTGIPVEDFEKEEVKNSVLGEEWTQYIVDFYGNSPKDYANQSSTIYGTEKDMLFNSENDMHSTRIKKLTIRDLLQRVGTDAIRNVIHPDAWVIALMNQYKLVSAQFGIIDFSGNTNTYLVGEPIVTEYPNWIITDVRFPNEYESIKQRKGIVIRVNREYKWKDENGVNLISEQDEKEFKKSDLGKCLINPHPSETALDNHSFDYTIDNNGTIEELIEKIYEILIKEKVI